MIANGIDQTFEFEWIYKNGTGQNTPPTNGSTDYV